MASRAGDLVLFQVQDAFGNATQFVWFENFDVLFHDEAYLNSFQVTAVFSICVAVIGLAMSLLLATMADRVIRGSMTYRTLLIWPYAVAPAVAGVLWGFLFAPSIGVVSFVLRKMGIDWNWVLRGDQAMLLVVMAATWKQVSYNFLFFLAGLQSIPRSLIEAAAIDGAEPVQALLDDRVPAALAHDVLPAGDQHGVRVLRHLRRHRRNDVGAARRRRPTSWSTRCTRTA